VLAGRAGVGAVTLAILGLAVFPWFEHLLRQAGRPTQLNANPIPYLLALMIAAMVGAVLASRRPRHPVGGTDHDRAPIECPASAVLGLSDDDVLAVLRHVRRRWRLEPPDVDRLPVRVPVGRILSTSLVKKPAVGWPPRAR
jgi:hypothetical protein